jgi:hypothetical protein
LDPVWNKEMRNIGMKKNAGMKGSQKWETTGFQNTGMQDLGCLDCSK